MTILKLNAIKRCTVENIDLVHVHFGAESSIYIRTILTLFEISHAKNISKASGKVRKPAPFDFFFTFSYLQNERIMK